MTRFRPPWWIGLVPILMALASVLLLMLIGLLSPAHGQEAPDRPCGPAREVMTELFSRFGEKPVRMGVSDGGYLVLTENLDKGTSTVLLIDEHGRACMVSGAAHWRAMEPKGKSL